MGKVSLLEKEKLSPSSEREGGIVWSRRDASVLINTARDCLGRGRKKGTGPSDRVTRDQVVISPIKRRGCRRDPLQRKFGQPPVSRGVHWHRGSLPASRNGHYFLGGGGGGHTGSKHLCNPGGGRRDSVTEEAPAEARAIFRKTIVLRKKKTPTATRPKKTNPKEKPKKKKKKDLSPEPLSPPKKEGA